MNVDNLAMVMGPTILGNSSNDPMAVMTEVRTDFCLWVLFTSGQTYKEDIKSNLFKNSYFFHFFWNWSQIFQHLRVFRLAARRLWWVPWWVSPATTGPTSWPSKTTSWCWGPGPKATTTRPSSLPTRRTNSCLPRPWQVGIWPSLRLSFGVTPE